jgi:hypothetical protein
MVTLSDYTHHSEHTLNLKHVQDLHIQFKVKIIEGDEDAAIPILVPNVNISPTKAYKSMTHITFNGLPLLEFEGHMHCKAIRTGGGQVHVTLLGPDNSLTCLSKALMGST